MAMAKYSTSVRLPIELEKTIREKAESNMRSISNEIIFALTNYYKDQGEQHTSDYDHNSAVAL